MAKLSNKSRVIGKVMKLPDGSRAIGKVALLSASQGLQAKYFGNCRLQQLTAPLKIPKGCLEALHPNQFVWLVCKSVRDLVHSLVCSLVAVIESNDLLELDLQLPS